MSRPEPDTATALIATDRTPLLPAIAEDIPPPSSIANGHGHLRKVADNFPFTVWVIAIIEFCERFAYFGVLGPMQNYIQNPRDDPIRSGGIGLGQAHATLVNQSFMIWCFLTPVVGAVVAEQYLGRVKTILYSAAIYSGGLAILVLSSLPAVQETVISLPGLLLSLFLIGVGTGGIKANVSPLLAEQYTSPGQVIRLLKSGETVIIDRDLTVQRMFATYFLFINAGCLAALASVEIEHSYGFSAAFAIPMTVFIIGFIALIHSKDRYNSSAPDGSIIPNVLQALWITIKHKGNLNCARPALEPVESPYQEYPWTNSFIDDLQTALSASKVFLFYPFYWAAFSQLLTNFISQAATMQTHGIPNDILPYMNPITTLFLLPLLDRLIFPTVRNLGYPVHHFPRITAGFMVCALAMLYAAFVQRTIYVSPPCYDHPRSPTCMHGQVPNDVSVLLQVPAYILVASSECLASVAGLEYAYANAPKSMRSLIMALYLSTVSVGTFLAMAVMPLTVDPKITWMYIVLAMAVFGAGAALWSVPVQRKEAG
ncbi:H+/oligopeptide symporter [Aspergillus saccharolyticus JOP 1030-1]|uniref:H+/oligopeptide symporter n=1 Tax=Aspergillus saccharolyticus JOP 1030-1 TaxID=1450539 RepID=A0A318Z9M9_9EURO|nr:H+/oligopeptide symporter [Aspergillus saccharolyticus JOP 1030-1]PYH40240.1 H+/oligopeptide symporter [Aspergillus saccharolyticus JOP 1030-1]